MTCGRVRLSLWDPVSGTMVRCVKLCGVITVFIHPTYPAMATLQGDDLFGSTTDLLAGRKELIARWRADLQCCARCALRYASVRDPAAYALPEHVLERATAAGEATAPSGAICPCCLGCLQQCVGADTVNVMAETVRAAGYEMRSFSLAISLPVQLIVRERAAWLHLKRTVGASASGTGRACREHPRSSAEHPPPALPDAVAQAAPPSSTDGGDCTNEAIEYPSFASIVDMKDAVRWALSESLGRALGVPSDGGTALVVHVTFRHTPSDGEHHALLRQLLPTESSHGKRKRPAGQPASELDSIRAVQRALGVGDRADDALVRSSELCPPRPPATACTAQPVVEREAVTLAGRYRKLSRSLPQSPWLVEGGVRKCEGSGFALE